jgi:hypothetical protein
VSDFLYEVGWTRVLMYLLLHNVFFVLMCHCRHPRETVSKSFSVVAALLCVLLCSGFTRDIVLCRCACRICTSVEVQCGREWAVRRVCSCDDRSWWTDCSSQRLACCYTNNYTLTFASRLSIARQAREQHTLAALAQVNHRLAVIVIFTDFAPIPSSPLGLHT